MVVGHMAQFPAAEGPGVRCKRLLDLLCVGERHVSTPPTCSPFPNPKSWPPGPTILRRNSRRFGSICTTPCSAHSPEPLDRSQSMKTRLPCPLTWPFLLSIVCCGLSSSLCGADEPAPLKNLL